MFKTEVGSSVGSTVLAKAATYHRCSTDEQNPDLARKVLRQAAMNMGYELAFEVEETGSGARNDRPGLQRVLEAARRGEIQCVIVWALDRFGRSTIDLLGNIQELSDRGVRFTCTSQSIDIKPGSGDPAATLMLTVLAGVAQFERQMIRERTKQGLRRLKAKGVRLGRPMKRGNTRPDVDRVRELRAQGQSWAEIAKALSCSPTSARRAAG